MNVAQLLFSANKAIPGKIKNENTELPIFAQTIEGILFEQSLELPKHQESVHMETSEERQTTWDELVSLSLNSGDYESSKLAMVDQTEEQIVDEPSVQLPEHIQTHLIAINTEINDVYTMLMEEDNLSEAANKLITLLERWSQVNSLIINEYRSFSDQSMEFENPKLQSLWKNLIKTYERRNSFNQLGQYGSEAKVDQKAVIQWLKHALQDDLTSHVPRIQHQSFSQINPMSPMSHVEQYVIHIQQTNQPQSPSADQQLIDKFSQAIRTSRFLSMNNGVNQMLFNLKPNHLGEMSVRLIEVNGEMTAKILVTSEATRKALQSNLHQLKNMFSPHQVVIERQDEFTTQQIHEEQDDLREQDENSEQPLGEQHKRRQENDSNEDHESFHEVLNEKV